MFIVGLGAVLFGIIIGWIAYRMLRMRNASTPWISDLITILALVGSIAILALFRSEALFGWYTFGLGIGFFAYFGVGVYRYGWSEVLLWRPAQTTSVASAASQPVSPDTPTVAQPVTPEVQAAAQTSVSDVQTDNLEKVKRPRTRNTSTEG